VGTDKPQNAHLPEVAADDQKQPFEQIILHADLPEIGQAPKHAGMTDWRERREAGADEAAQAERAPLRTPEPRTEEGHGGYGAEGQDLQALHISVESATVIIIWTGH
jgi:hypothetical protein